MTSSSTSLAGSVGIDGYGHQRQFGTTESARLVGDQTKHPGGIGA